MVTQLRINQIDVLPGQQIVLHDVDWAQFESILADLGEERRSRIAYYDNILEIRMPLPEHERAIVIISDLLKILLDESGAEWESLRSSTFRKATMKAGIEPDDCFYIQNYAAVVGKKRLDLNIDPPPDLALEVELTSMTQMSAYEALGVPEIWRYRNNQLKIARLREGKYVESDSSLALPNFIGIDSFSGFIKRGAEVPMSQVRREFRQLLST